MNAIKICLTFLAASLVLVSMGEARPRALSSYKGIRDKQLAERRAQGPAVVGNHKRAWEKRRSPRIRRNGPRMMGGSRGRSPVYMPTAYSYGYQVPRYGVVATPVFTQSFSGNSGVIRSNSLGSTRSVAQGATRTFTQSSTGNISTGGARRTLYGTSSRQDPSFARTQRAVSGFQRRYGFAD